MNQELHHLIKEAQNGSLESFEALVTQYKGHVYRQAYAMVNDKMEAEDISQEAFIKAYYSLGKLENAFAFVSWLTRIVSNICYDHIQKAAKKKTYPTEQPIEDHHSPIEASSLQLSIKEALQTLTPEHRAAIVLRDVQGFSYQDISGILQIPLGTVKSRINAARIELKNELLRGEDLE